MFVVGLRTPQQLYNVKQRWLMDVSPSRLTILRRKTYMKLKSTQPLPPIKGGREMFKWLDHHGINNISVWVNQIDMLLSSKIFFRLWARVWMTGKLVVHKFAFLWVLFYLFSQAEMSLLLYPVFVHMYLELICNSHGAVGDVFLQHTSDSNFTLIVLAAKFFSEFSSVQESFYADDLSQLKCLKDSSQLKSNVWFCALQWVPYGIGGSTVL